MVTLESQLSVEKQDKSRLTAELDAERQRSTSLESQSNELAAKLEIQKSAHNRSLEEAKVNFQKLLRQRLQEEQESWEQKRKEEELTRQSESKSQLEKPGKLKLDTSRTQLSRERSVDSRASNGALISPSNGWETSLSAAHLTSNGMNAGAVIDRLHGIVKQLEGQVSGLQSQLQSVSKTRDELADELVKLTAENEQLWVLRRLGGVCNIVELTHLCGGDRKSSLLRVDQLEKELSEINTRCVGNKILEIGACS